MPGIQWFTLERMEGVTPDDLHRGQYLPLRRKDLHGDQGWCIVACPKCGTLALILREVHTVNYDGVVTPNVTCPKGSCDFVANASLAGWVPEPMGSA